MNDIHLEPLGSGVNIYVSKSYHFSTDTILLADFSMPKSGKKCVDLGTGCGTIPLIWLKREKDLTVDAVEIQQNACTLAQKSVELNGFGDKMNVINSDLRELQGKLSFGFYDLVACNPPYKLSGSGIQNPESAKQIARHETECTFVPAAGKAGGHYGEYAQVFDRTKAIEACAAAQIKGAEAVFA